MPRIPPLFLVTLAGAACGGWWLGTRNAKTAAASQTAIAGWEAAVRGAKTDSPAAVGATSLTPDSPLAKWMAAVESAGNDDFPGLLEELALLFPGDPGPDGKTMAATRWLLGCWALKDADAAIRFVSTLTDPGMMAAMGEALARVRPDKALELLAARSKAGIKWDTQKVLELVAGRSEGDPSQDMHYAMAKRMAVTDPEAFLKLNPSCLGGEVTVSAAFAALAKRDPAKAGAMWESMSRTSGYAGRKSLYLMLDSLVAGDSAAARAWVEKLADPEQRSLASHALLTALARRDPRAALRELKSMVLGDFDDFSNASSIRLGLPPDSGDGQAAVILSLAKLDRAEGLAALKELLVTNPGLTSEKGYLLAQLTEVSRDQIRRYPEEPTAFLATLRESTAAESDPEWRHAMESAYLREQLEGRSAGFALELAKVRASELSAAAAGGKPDFALVEMLNHVAERDPEAVLGVMDQMPVKERQMVAEHIRDRTSLDDVEILGRLLPYESAKHWENLVDTYNGYLSSNPEKLKEMAPRYAALSGEAAVPAVTYYSQMWAQDDPVTALNWAVTLPPETLAAAVGGAVQSWMKSDDAAASEWADALPDGPVRDAASAGLAKALVEFDLPSAMAWAGDISDPAAATEVLEKNGREFQLSG